MIVGLIVVAFAGGIKLIKDVWEKKPAVKWIFYSEIVIICLALFIGIFGRKTQTANDETKVNNQNKRQDSAILHTDTSINHSTQAILDSARESEKRTNEQLKKIQQEKSQYQAEKAIDRKPNLDIRVSHDYLNPVITERVKDSFDIVIVIENFGDSYASSLHIRTFLVKKDKQGLWLPLLNPTENSMTNRLTPIVPGERLSVRRDFWVNNFYLPEEDFYLGVLYWYKDSLQRPANQLRLYRWKRKGLTAPAFYTDDNEVEFFTKLMKANKLWPDSVL